jgi:putative hemolysin
MHNRQRTWLWASAAVSFAVGFVLVLNDSGAGWFLIIMGIVYIGVSTRAGQGLAVTDPRLARWGLIGVTVLLVTLAVIVGVLAAGGAAPEPSPAPAEAGLPNPASVFCEEQGGRLEIRTDSSAGQTGSCIFADGSECEEWAYFRGECAPADGSSPPSPPAEIVESVSSPPEGWETYTHPSLGYTFFYPAGSNLESDDSQRYVTVVGPLEDDEHWPWFSVAHPDEQDYHPPDDADLGRWLAERNRLSGEVVGTRTVAGEVAIHTRNDNGPQAYHDDRFYFAHEGQVFEITISHAGRENWAVYDQFLDSFHF